MNDPALTHRQARGVTTFFQGHLETARAKLEQLGKTDGWARQFSAEYWRPRVGEQFETLPPGLVVGAVHESGEVEHDYEPTGQLSTSPDGEGIPVMRPRALAEARIWAQILSLARRGLACHSAYDEACCEAGIWASQAQLKPTVAAIRRRARQQAGGRNSARSRQRAASEERTSLRATVLNAPRESLTSTDALIRHLVEVELAERTGLGIVFNGMGYSRKRIQSYRSAARRKLLI